ncbi:hypothetical protein [Colwellia sp. MB02u-9]|uniref:hypothetical protein n=1 Tax=Colwellia sp. MB02u-9 TaxID=2759823 RepID=UPI0015F66092|nr:hypothetical protein [Colwellia sp. MB02u-9]MBA6297053.1 hypothetical protein [Colwellia sp. MB02u-9]
MLTDSETKCCCGYFRANFTYCIEVKALVISSRTLDTDSTYLQFSQIKDDMLKQLEISDIDPIIAKLEQGYSDKSDIHSMHYHTTPC